MVPTDENNNVCSKELVLLKNDPDAQKVINDHLDTVKTLLSEHEAKSAVAFAEWLRFNTDLKYNREIDSNLYIFNNQIYWAHLGCNIGSEQELYRPVLVIQSTKESPVCSIIPLTLERLTDGRNYHVDLDNGKSTALVEQVRVISKKRIDKYHYENGRYATITQNDWDRINTQLNKLYSLKPLFVKK